MWFISEQTNQEMRDHGEVIEEEIRQLQGNVGL